MIVHPANTAGTSKPTAAAGAPGRPAAPVPAAGKGPWHRFTRLFLDRIDRVSLSAKLVACTLVILIVGTVGISATIRQLVSGYMLEKTDSQIISQRDIVFQYVQQNPTQNSGLNSYFVEVRYAKDGKLTNVSRTPSYPVLEGNVVSMPQLPSNAQITADMLGKPFTTSAKVVSLQTMSSNSSGTVPGTGTPDASGGAADGSGSTGSDGSSDQSANGADPGQSQQSSPDGQSSDASGSSQASGTPVTSSRKTLQAASAPWRVGVFQWEDKETGAYRGVVFIGLSLADQIDTINTLTRYCITVGIAIVLLGGSLSALIIQRTLDPLKRIEKTAAKIAAGDLSQRVPYAPENTEVGSLSASLNMMLTRIEQSFHEQEQTTAKMKRFVSDASHELRTPLAAIHGYAELYTMQRGMPGALERADESIAHIERSSQRMTVLVEDLLSLARLDEGRGIDMTQTVSLTTLVTDAVDDLHALDPQREVTRGTVAFEPSSDMTHPSTLGIEGDSMASITITGDASRLRQVVTNIVGNIHRYTPDDSPARVGLGVVAASITPEQLSRMPSNDESLRRFLEAAEVGHTMHTGTNYAVLRFEDHGPGVPAESRAQIFERFYTADPSRAREKGGTGLGLAIAQSVVKAHRGLICATETSGGGLTFTIMLPLGPVDANASSEVGAAAATGKNGGAAGSAKQARQTKRGKDGKGGKDGGKRGSWFSRSR
ncbi:histidine kinase sensor of two-component system [Bifidobacterium callitrichos DSM 23973]|uniref:histidine kinase n=2 Tax=Bifidobacterium callitrichos TaxID=762209 RepID=A0A087ACJ5_9BIFI|nr:HAMP domain-containing sensor histidine kinase [Bifidobacterium callitrichos]KFI56495.1 histidine kinase sensor of two-component system [Bifidobacterium callitrichos DSM 23973]